jgi:hypothetical protein
VREILRWPADPDPAPATLASMHYAYWINDFETAAARRGSDPVWRRVALHSAVIRSVQRFQTGEDGDGASLIAKSSGDREYLAAVRMFVAEEQNHARLLKLLLEQAGADTIDGHWSDRVFVAVRRSLGLRLELMTLMVAEVVALRYYRALRDGTDDPTVTEVAGRILADEQRHVPFHTDRLRAGFGHLPGPVRALLAAAWWVLLLGASAVVAVDHGAALRQLGVPPTRFLADVAGLFRAVVVQVLRVPRKSRVPIGAGR